tara:strand:- start:726 stop:1055 length:330 start_codon:yes stop_codon:yes gene_type:complete
MNKILPILLVVVLSGCGSNLLEKCADDDMYMSFDFPNMEYYLVKSDYEKCEAQHQLEIMYQGCLEDAIREKFYSQPLEVRLKNYTYERGFQRCEIQKSKYPETFTTKWK